MAGVDSLEMSLSVVDVVVSFSEVEVDDADGVYLFDVRVVLSDVDVFGDGFGYSKENALQVVELARVLDLNEDDFAVAVFGFYVDAVEFIGAVLLVGLAFQNLYNFDLLVLYGG